MNVILKTVTSLLVGFNIQSDHLNSKNAFKQIDTAQNGTIGHLDLLKFAGDETNEANEMKWKLVVSGADLNHNDKLNYIEFVTASINHSNLINKDNIKKAFTLLDSNRDGKIDI